MSCRYAAFISYASADTAFAKKLHRALEAYVVPRALGNYNLVSGGKPNRIYPVFRDREELAAGQLGSALEANLRASSALVVICSSAAAASQWVAREIEYFRSLPQGGRIFALIAPEALASVASDSTSAYFPAALGGEPLAADARSTKDGFDYALLKVIAGLIGVAPGALRDRDRIESRKRLGRRALTACAVLAAAAAGVGTVAELGRRTDLASNGNSLFALAPLGALISTESSQVRAAAGDSLRHAALITPDETGGTISAAGFAPNDSWVVVGLTNGSLVRITTSGERAETIAWPRVCADSADTMWPDCAVFAVDVEEARIVAGDASGTVASFDEEGAVIASKRVHFGPVAGVAILAQSAQLASAGLQGDLAILAWPSLELERQLNVACRVRTVQADESGRVALSCTDGRVLTVAPDTGVVVNNVRPVPLALGAFQLSNRVDSEDESSGSIASIRVRRVVASARETLVALTDDGVTIRYGEIWLPAPFLDRWAVDDQNISLSRTGRFLVFNERIERGEWALVDLADYAAFDTLIRSSDHLRQDVCRSRWAGRLRSERGDPCERKGLLTAEGWLQIPQAFADLWGR